MKSVRDFAVQQLGRLGLRAWLLLHGIAAAVFWALFLVMWSYLAHWGMVWLAWMALWGYIIVSAPFLILQAVMIADVLAFGVIGKTFAFGPLEKAALDYAKANPDIVNRIPWRVQALVFLADASPISCIALWSFVVLQRAPVGAHQRLPVLELKRQEIALERAVYGTATARLGLARI